MSDYDNARRAAARRALRRAELRALRFERDKPELKEPELERHQLHQRLRLEQVKRDSRLETLEKVGYFFVTIFIIAVFLFSVYMVGLCFFSGNCGSSHGNDDLKDEGIGHFGPRGQQ